MPLCIAAAYRNTNIVRYLIEEHGADINRAADGGRTPLFAAAHNGHVNLVRCMVEELGADVNNAEDNGGTPLYMPPLR
jgi:ankyrin repeat protein